MLTVSPEHDLAREHAVGDEQAEVRRIGVDEAPTVPLADGKGRHAHAQLVLGGRAALVAEELPELRIELEQRPTRTRSHASISGLASIPTRS